MKVHILHEACMKKGAQIKKRVSHYKSMHLLCKSLPIRFSRQFTFMSTPHTDCIFNINLTY